MLKLTQLIETYFFNKNFYELVSIPTTTSNFIPNKVVTFNDKANPGLTSGIPFFAKQKFKGSWESESPNYGGKAPGKKFMFKFSFCFSLIWAHNLGAQTSIPASKAFLIHHCHLG